MTLHNRFLVILGDKRIDLSDFVCVEYGTSINGSLPDVLEHTPDTDISTPVRAVPNAKNYQLTITDLNREQLDLIQKRIRPLKQLLNDSDSRALRGSSRRDAPTCYIRTQLKGNSEWTQWGVKFGEVNDAQSYTLPQSEISQVAWQIVISLVCYPRGEQKTQTLRNDLASSPHMIEDSNSDGLADGLQLLGAVLPTPTITSDVWIIGGMSQRVACNGITLNQGIRTNPPIIIAAGGDVHARVWVAHVSGDDIIVEIEDSASNIIDSQTLTVGQPVNETTDDRGVTWSCVELSGTMIAANARIRVRRPPPATAITVFFVDGLYFSTEPYQVNQQPNPLLNIPDAIDPALPEGFSVVAGTPTTTLTSTDKLFGQRAVDVSANAALDAIQTDPVFGINTYISAYTWVLVKSGSVNISLRGSVDYGTVTLDSSDSNNVADDKIANGIGTWWRVSFDRAFTDFGGLPSAFIYYECVSASTRFVVDNLFLDTVNGAYIDELPRWPLQLPRAWVSASYVKNRYDPSISEGNINYLDTFGVAGDMNPVIDVKLKPDDTAVATEYNRLYAYRNLDRLYLAATFTHWLEVASPEFIGTNWANVADATRTNGNFFRYTDAGSSGETADTPVSSGITNLKSLLSLPFQVYAICRSSSTTTTLHFNLFVPNSKGFNVISGDPVSVTTPGQWELLELGLSEGVDSLPKELGFGTSTTPDLRLTTANAPLASTFDIDALLFMPSDQSLITDFLELIKNSGIGLPPNEAALISGTNKYVTSQLYGIERDSLANYWGGVSGAFMMRHVFGVGADKTTGEYDINHANIITLEITPTVSSFGGGDTIV